ncbi:uncharacterized protein LOC135816224 [Sycon ciliatum]|uniref:uncharacterized protein LOC135816224 n=1 Tax=Sycon ciliatum TaxID=27933 RepID=UPI0031F6EA2B
MHAECSGVEIVFDQIVTSLELKPECRLDRGKPNPVEMRRGKESRHASQWTANSGQDQYIQYANNCSNQHNTPSSRFGLTSDVHEPGQEQEGSWKELDVLQRKLNLNAVTRASGRSEYFSADSSGGSQPGSTIQLAPPDSSLIAPRVAATSSKDQQQVLRGRPATHSSQTWSVPAVEAKTRDNSKHDNTQAPMWTFSYPSRISGNEFTQQNPLSLPTINSSQCTQCEREFYPQHAESNRTGTMYAAHDARQKQHVQPNGCSPPKIEACIVGTPVTVPAVSRNKSRHCVHRTAGDVGVGPCHSALPPPVPPGSAISHAVPRHTSTAAAANTGVEYNSGSRMRILPSTRHAYDLTPLQVSSHFVPIKKTMSSSYQNYDSTGAFSRHNMTSHMECLAARSTQRRHGLPVSRIVPQTLTGIAHGSQAKSSGSRTLSKETVTGKKITRLQRD